MANAANPFGFELYGSNSGRPNFAQAGSGTPYKILSTYSTKIFWGDLVRMNASLTGYVEQWTAADGGTATQIPVGIFNGCRYFSASRQEHVFSRFWPGGDASQDGTAFIIDDPDALFKVQAGGVAAITQTSLGVTADISSTPVGSVYTGLSGMSLAAPTSSNSIQLPFKVASLITSPPGANGTDLTTPYNYVIVSFNNQTYKSLIGI